MTSQLFLLIFQLQEEVGRAIRRVFRFKTTANESRSFLVTAIIGHPTIKLHDSILCAFRSEKNFVSPCLLVLINGISTGKGCEVIGVSKI